MIRLRKWIHICAVAVLLAGCGSPQGSPDALVSASEPVAVSAVDEIEQGLGRIENTLTDAAVTDGSEGDFLIGLQALIDRDEAALAQVVENKSNASNWNTMYKMHEAAASGIRDLKADIPAELSSEVRTLLRSALESRAKSHLAKARVYGVFSLFGQIDRRKRRDYFNDIDGICSESLDLQAQSKAKIEQARSAARTEPNGGN